MAPHSSTLTWKIPWMEEPGRLQSMGSLRLGHDQATSLSLFSFMHWRRKWQLTPVFLPGESQGRRSLVGCCLWVTQSQTRLKQHSSSSYYKRNSPKWYLCWQPVVKNNNKKCACWGTSVMSNSATVWTVVCQVPLFMELSRQKYQSGLSCPPPGDLPHPGIKPMSITSQALASRFFTTSATREVITHMCVYTHTRIYTHAYIWLPVQQVSTTA